MDTGNAQIQINRSIKTFKPHPMSKKFITTDLLQAVINELDAIRTLPLEQRLEVKLETFNPQRYNTCIYGRLFGSSLLESVTTFKQKHEIPTPFKYVCNYNASPMFLPAGAGTAKEYFDNLQIEHFLKKGFETGFNFGHSFSNLEFYITLPDAKLTEVIGYIRSETDDINLAL